MANGIAFVIFSVSRQVEWRYCLLAMVTCAVGGYIICPLCPQGAATRAARHSCVYRPGDGRVVLLAERVIEGLRD